jgi:hypothetical protein
VFTPFVMDSSAYTTLEMSFGSSAYMVVVHVLAEGIDPPLHWIGFILAVIGLVLATRLWAVLLGLLGCALWGWTGMIMTGLMVT